MSREANKGPHIISVQPKRAKIGFFPARCDTKSLNGIYQFAKGRFSVQLFEGGALRDIFELMKQSTICWFEGLSGLTVIPSRLPKTCRNIVRLDESELRSELSKKINWQNIDVLIVDDVAVAREYIPYIGEQTRVVAINPDGGAAAEGCDDSSGMENYQSQVISRANEFFVEFEKRPFHYNGEMNFCRNRLAQYCQGKGVDVGCGDNKILPDAIGIDVTNMANEVAANVRHLPFEDESMDYLFSSHCLKDLEDAGGALGEWMRVLRPGGKLVLYLPRRNFYPKVGPPGANPTNKHDMNPNFVLAALSETNDYDIVCVDEFNAGEYGFSLVVRKLHRELPERKVLVEYHAAIGDAICMEPAVRALKQQLGEDVAVILRVTHPELFRNHPSVSRVEHTMFPPRCDTYEKKYKLSVEPTKQNRRSHLVDRAAEQIGVSLEDRTPRLYLDRWDEMMLEKFQLPYGDGLKIAISPDVQWPSRQWEDSKWAQLCTMLERELGATIIQLGAAGVYMGNSVVDLVGQTSPREAAAVLSRCDLLVSVDTGPAHLAAAVGTSCVGIFGPIYPELRMHPDLGRAVIAADAECRGCFHWYDGNVRNCPKGHHECMRLIGVESVLDAVYKVLDRSELPRSAVERR